MGSYLMRTKNNKLGSTRREVGLLDGKRVSEEVCWLMKR
jgi:hypothetical protein